ncbi:hypothetical protein GOP47_0006311 [Adiantum capillus-veneris]|uniref:Uncharacterized protein n=1 Tax=Adiantum capillus-veneris TaxID=13818 RepID=A0A9D4ZMX3_ADICA|nr:hypothetical protein GOP47_0006311 [Adiantum capillus-veneris]
MWRLIMESTSYIRWHSGCDLGRESERPVYPAFWLSTCIIPLRSLPQISDFIHNTWSAEFIQDTCVSAKYHLLRSNPHASSYTNERESASYR